MNCLHNFRTENKLKSHEKICKSKDFCGIVIPAEKDNIDGCTNNPEKYSTTKIGEHIPCGYSVSTIWGFDHIEDKHTLYRGKDCMKKFCTSLREQAKKIINFEKKKMLPLTKEELKSHQDAKVCYNYEKKKY